MNSSFIHHPYAFPKQAAFGRVVPKSKIYEKADPSVKIRKLFVEQIERITWSYKLAPGTTNLPVSEDVHEIQVFTVELRQIALNYDLLRVIDRAVLTPIIFVLKFSGKMRYVAAYKRFSEADSGKRVVSDYFETEWMPEDAEPVEMPLALNLGTLYHALLGSFVPVRAERSENFGSVIARAERFGKIQREVTRLETQRNREKQFNRRVELNRKLNEMRIEIEELEK